MVRKVTKSNQKQIDQKEKLWDAEVAYFAEARSGGGGGELAKNVAKKCRGKLNQCSCPFLFSYKGTLREFSIGRCRISLIIHLITVPSTFLPGLICPSRSRLMAKLFIIQIHQLVNVIATVKKKY